MVDAFGGTGGIAQYNRDLLSAWSSLENVQQIVVLTRRSSPSKQPLPEKVVQYPPVENAFLYGMRAVAHSTWRRRFDIVFCGHLHMMPLAVIVSKLSGAPIWLQLHGIEAWQNRAGFFRWCVEKATLVTAVSRFTRRQFLRWANIEAIRVQILPNTVGEQFIPTKDRISAKKKYGLAGKRVLLTVSRLAKTERYKGHVRIIECLSAIRNTEDDLAYVIAGDGDMRTELEELVRRKKLEDVVVFIGNVANEELPGLYQAADVFVMPSTGEGFGIVYLEALACGTPVIAGDRDGAHDPLHDGMLGMLVNEHELAAGIERILRKPEFFDYADRGNRDLEYSVRNHFGRSVFNEIVRGTTELFEITDHPYAMPRTRDSILCHGKR